MESMEALEQTSIYPSVCLEHVIVSDRSPSNVIRLGKGHFLILKCLLAAISSSNHLTCNTRYNVRVNFFFKFFYWVRAQLGWSSACAPSILTQWYRIQQTWLTNLNQSEPCWSLIIYLMYENEMRSDEMLWHMTILEVLCVCEWGFYALSASTAIFRASWKFCTLHRKILFTINKYTMEHWNVYMVRQADLVYPNSLVYTPVAVPGGGERGGAHPSLEKKSTSKKKRKKGVFNKQKKRNTP